MRNPFKDGKGRQDVLLLLGDGSVDLLSLTVKMGYAADLEHGEMDRAWGIAKVKNQMLSRVKDIGDTFIQFCDEKDVTPLTLFDEAEESIVKQTIDRVSQQITSNEITYSSKRKENKSIKWYGWIAIIFALAISAIVVFKVLHSNTDPQTISNLINLLGGWL